MQTYIITSSNRFNWKQINIKLYFMTEPNGIYTLLSPIFLGLVLTFLNSLSQLLHSVNRRQTSRTRCCQLRVPLLGNLYFVASLAWKKLVQADLLFVSPHVYINNILYSCKSYQNSVVIIKKNRDTKKPLKNLLPKIWETLS